MREVAGSTPDCSLNGPLGAHRRWSCARAELSDVRQVKATLGGTVNDIVLACITGGFRDLLDARHEPVPDGFARWSGVGPHSRPSTATTTTACPRSSPSCPSASPIPSHDSTASVPRWPT